LIYINHPRATKTHNLTLCVIDCAPQKTCR
jgi:hypothetical protein